MFILCDSDHEISIEQADFVERRRERAQELRSG